MDIVEHFVFRVFIWKAYTEITNLYDILAIHISVFNDMFKSMKEVLY